MPGTWADVARSFDWESSFKSAFNPERAIKAGARYQAMQRRMWQETGRTPVQRNDLGACNYNAGAANCLKAQRLCGGARLWPDVQPCLQLVTGARFAGQTSAYIRSINGLALVMVVRP